MAFNSLAEKMRAIWKYFEAELITARDVLCFLLLGKIAKEKEWKYFVGKLPEITELPEKALLNIFKLGPVIKQLKVAELALNIGSGAERLFCNW